MTVPIRLAVAEDAQSLAPLLSELGFVGSDATISSRLQFLLQDESKLHAVAVDHANEVIGFLSAEMRCFIQAGAFCELIALVVTPSARRSGVAKALVEHAGQWAADRGLSAVRVRSSITRSESHPFYEALDFTLLKTQHCYIKACKPNNSFNPMPLRGTG